jgi:hypothetical protein
LATAFYKVRRKEGMGGKRRKRSEEMEGKERCGKRGRGERERKGMRKGKREGKETGKEKRERERKGEGKGKGKGKE